MDPALQVFVDQLNARLEKQEDGWYHLPETDESYESWLKPFVPVDQFLPSTPHLLVMPRGDDFTVVNKGTREAFGDFKSLEAAKMKADAVIAQA